MGSNPRDGAMGKDGCPLCGAKVVYLGFNMIECRGPACKNYKAPTKEEIQQAIDQVTSEAALNWTRYYGLAPWGWNFKKP